MSGTEAAQVKISAAHATPSPPVRHDVHDEEAGAGNRGDDHARHACDHRHRLPLRIDVGHEPHGRLFSTAHGVEINAAAAHQRQAHDPATADESQHAERNDDDADRAHRHVANVSAYKQADAGQRRDRARDGGRPRSGESRVLEGVFADREPVRPQHIGTIPARLGNPGAAGRPRVRGQASEMRRRVVHLLDREQVGDSHS